MAVSHFFSFWFCTFYVGWTEMKYFLSWSLTWGSNIKLDNDNILVKFCELNVCWIVRNLISDLGFEYLPLRLPRYRDEEKWSSLLVCFIFKLLLLICCLIDHAGEHGSLVFMLGAEWRSIFFYKPSGIRFLSLCSAIYFHLLSCIKGQTIRSFYVNHLLGCY